jgi:hypothetical protein
VLNNLFMYWLPIINIYFVGKFMSL